MNWDNTKFVLVIVASIFVATWLGILPSAIENISGAIRLPFFN